MKVDALASAAPMSVDEFRPRHMRKQRKRIEVCRVYPKERCPHSEDDFPDQTSASGDIDSETDHLYLSDHKLVVPV